MTQRSRALSGSINIFRDDSGVVELCEIMRLSVGDRDGRQRKLARIGSFKNRCVLKGDDRSSTLVRYYFVYVTTPQYDTS